MQPNNKPIILGIDFDGTIATSSWPELGDLKPEADKYIRRLKEQGYYIIIWTCRSGDHVDQIKEWLRHHDVPFDQINEHHPALVAHYQNDTRKICADIYLDDRSLGGLPSKWETIYNAVLQHSLFIDRPCLDI